jgi:hypothetical protein
MRQDAPATDWLALIVIAFFAMPLTGMVAAMLALDVTRSLEAHVTTAAALPFVVVMLVGRRLGAPAGLALRLGLVAALFALVLLDLGWSGLPTA